MNWYHNSIDHSVVLHEFLLMRIDHHSTRVDRKGTRVDIPLYGVYLFQLPYAIVLFCNVIRLPVY
jgi:hypothetical protein